MSATKETLEEMYWGEGLPLKLVGQRLGMCAEGVRYHMMKNGIPTRSLGEAGKLSVIKGRDSKVIIPNLSPSPQLAYVLSTILGDGYVGRNKYNRTVTLSVIDEEFADAFMGALQSINLRPCKFLVNCPGKNQYRVVATSLKFYGWYKSLSYEDIEKLACSYPHEFLRGIFDSEGSFRCCWREKKQRPNPMLVCEVNISNADKTLIDICQKVASQLGFSFRKMVVRIKKENRKDKWVLFLTKREDALRFLKEIKPSISRKSLEKYEKIKDQVTPVCSYCGTSYKERPWVSHYNRFHRYSKVNDGVVI